MNLKQLEYFSAVAEAKSISLAARNLHVAQPPISRQLALLEDELGVCLFLRTNKGVELTEAGRSLYRQSQNLFQDMRMIVDSVRDINAGMRGLLKIGMIYSNISIALQYLKEFRAQYPQVELYVRLGSPGDLLEDLNKGDLHLLFLRSSSERGSGLHERILGEDPLELVMIRELDPAPDQASVPLEALKGVPMCLLRSDDLWGYSNYLIKECQRQGFTPNTTFRCYDTPLYVVYEQVRALAERYGTYIVDSEIVGLTPAKAMIDCAEFYLKARDFNCHNQIMEYHLLDMK